MKKIVGTILAIALVASSAFAEVNVGMGFNRGVFTPFAMQKNGDADAEMYMGNSASWGWGGPRVGVGFSAGSDEIGVVADVKFDGGNVAVNDNAYIWVKPFSWLKLQLGQSFDDTLRSGASYGSWDLFRASRSARGDDAIFKRVCDVNHLYDSNGVKTMAEAIGSAGHDESVPLRGAILMLDPIEGLHVSVGLPIDYESSEIKEAILPYMQIQAGYTISGIGQVKAQWIGLGKDIEDKQQGIINAAFCLDAIEGMDLDFGFFMSTVEKSDITITAFWGMPIDALKLNANAEIVIDRNDATNKKMGIAAGVGAAYDLGNGLNVGADFRITMDVNENEVSNPRWKDKAAFEIGAWVGKGIANGSITLGAQVFINEKPNGMFADYSDAAEKGITFAIPVMFQCFF